MWRVYREIGSELLGVLHPMDTTLAYYKSEEEARAAYRRAVRALREAGYQPTDEVAPVDMESVVEWAGLEHPDGRAAIVVLLGGE